MPTYWEQRAIDSIGRMESAVNGAIPELVLSFEKAKRDLTGEILKFYGKYAANNAVTLQEAEKILSFAELREFKGNLKEFEILARESIGTFDLQVANLSTKARVTRLQALETQCDGILQKLYQEQRKLVQDVATDVYTEEYYRSQFSIEQYTGFQYNFASPSSEVIGKVLKMPVQGSDISTRLWRQDIDTGFRIRQALNQMFVTGRPPQYFAEELQKAIGAIRSDENGVGGTGKKYEAYRLLYNESAQATNQANLQAYKDDGIDEYEIIATLDGFTSQVCREQDAKHYPIEKAITGVNFPPFHVNCRTTTAPYISNLKNLKSTRMARDPITGKSVRAADTNYGEWSKTQDEKYGSDKVRVAEKMEKNEKPDFEQYQKYKTIFGKNKLKSFANFQDLKYNNSEEWASLKAQKQDVLNAKNFDDIIDLKGKLGNLETRLWYKAHDENISTLIDVSLPLEGQARQASELRSSYRTQARELMADKEAREQLNNRNKNVSFEQLLEHKKFKYGLTGEEAYKDIIRSSKTTNIDFDRKAGIK